MNGTRAVLLDLYDTLVWSEWPALRALIEQRVGLQSGELLVAFDQTRTARAVGTYGSMEADLDAVLAAAGSGQDAALVNDLAALITGFLETGVHLWDDSLPVLRELRKRGLRTAIVSNCDHGTRPVVERLALTREADAVLLSVEIGAAKPDPAIYLAALEALGARPEEAVFVDDQIGYCDGARSVGIRSLLIDRDGGDPPAEERVTGSQEVIRDLRSLLDRV